MKLHKFFYSIRSHRYGFGLFAFMTAAVLTGIVCADFAKVFDWVVAHRLDFGSVGNWAWLITPLGFVLAVEMIRRLAPHAAGTGIPQAIFASAQLTPATEIQVLPLVSFRTLVVKILTLFLGVWVGASTGREGPTVHVAVCLFIGILMLLRRATGVAFDLRSGAIAGGAAGLAAAFNTPLAGVTFAVEELSANYFGAVKDIVMMAIIVSAITAQVVTGEYSYFGKLPDPARISIPVVLLISTLCGLAGILFSQLLLKGSNYFRSRSLGAGRYGVAAMMGLALLVVAHAAGTRTMGPGNQVAQQLLHARFDSWVYLFPLAKMAATLFTYWSGIAGGIFAPCLSMGAALGSCIGSAIHHSIATCALLGMVSFLSGSIQAPITSFVIIFEMTGHHEMLLPVMLASLLAFMMARFLGAANFYQVMAASYGPMETSAARQ
jgi:H+/Cl- antiporter ClcA